MHYTVSKPNVRGKVRCVVYYNGPDGKRARKASKWFGKKKEADAWGEYTMMQLMEMLREYEPQHSSPAHKSVNSKSVSQEEFTDDDADFEDEGDEVTASGMTIGSLLNEYMEFAESKFPKKTIQEKERAVRRCLEFMKQDTPVQKIKPRHALKTLSRISKKYKEGQANRARKNLAAAWNWGVRYCGLPRQNPFKLCDKFKEDKVGRYVPPESDFWKVYELASPRDKVMLLTFLHTAIRREECFRLKWEDLDLEHSMGHIGSRKTRTGQMEYRTIALTNTLVSALREHRKQTVSEYVFTNPYSGKPYTSRAQFMPRICERARVKPFGYHGIRHLHATLMLHEGADLGTIQKQLRHSSPVTTARYIKDLGVDPSKVSAIFDSRDGSQA